MDVYVYSSGDGETKVFSDKDSAINYAFDQGAIAVDPWEDDRGTHLGWIVKWDDLDDIEGDILICTLH